MTMATPATMATTIKTHDGDDDDGGDGDDDVFCWATAATFPQQVAPQKKNTVARPPEAGQQDPDGSPQRR